ncbi:hypothetical protein PP2015_1707 [Pseudoalteromonas phenolica]|uniref:Uncharacterized protein n=1 Tax=Pseudoalteromonas phenolica TaxID=161398 RepID=A0A0S2K1T5_9GAMM|nr:hypothetical protein PP2015_1707 [Pseudoalteromonas phenolica]
MIEYYSGVVYNSNKFLFYLLTSHTDKLIFLYTEIYKKRGKITYRVLVLTKINVN